ncbi:MAG: aminotransferase class IV [Phycisphaerae bacterium]|jgi:D-alanine transaminase
MEIAVVNGSAMPLFEVDESVMDRGLFFGDGVYEVLRSYGGRLFALEDHLARLERSLREIQITGIDMKEIRALIERSFAASEIEDAAIYIHITRGCAPRAHGWKDGIKPKIFLTVREITDYHTTHKKGVKLCLAKDERWGRCDIKSLNLLPNVLAKQAALKAGCFEAILVDRRGDITEGSSSAFFTIFGNSIVTRPLGHEILPSITRKYVSLAAKAAGMEMEERILNPMQAAKADEIFIAVTTKDIVGAIEFNGKPVSAGVVGPGTRLLETAFREIVERGT